jgi:alpha-galactosidase
MIGAGSGFVVSIARELVTSDVLKGATFVLMDPVPAQLELAERTVRGILEEHNTPVTVRTCDNLPEALAGTQYVITSCEQRRWEFWQQDIEIPERHGVYQIMGENGGPGGQIHALRNIALFKGITDAMAHYCPDAWLLNFTNPMSYLCTYLAKYTPIRTLGFCHQVHGSFGVIAEQLGFQPGELEVITGGVNHFNWLLDVRLRGTGKSYLQEFLTQVRQSIYWQQKHARVPRQEFTLEILNTFGAYPVGYDDHIIEYLPFFYEREEWEEHGYESFKVELQKYLARKNKTSLAAMTLQGDQVTEPPFPRDPLHPYYAELPCKVIVALETNTPTYFDAINILNHGSIDNLPAEAIVDVPGLAIGGTVRGIHVGELPIAAMELCRRQITLHEMIARASAEGDAGLVVQALCLDPYVRSITQARRIWDDYYAFYKDYLPQFA